MDDPAESRKLAPVPSLTCLLPAPERTRVRVDWPTKPNPTPAPALGLDFDLLLDEADELRIVVISGLGVRDDSGGGGGGGCCLGTGFGVVNDVVDVPAVGVLVLATADTDPDDETPADALVVLRDNDSLLGNMTSAPTLSPALPPLPPFTGPSSSRVMISPLTTCIVFVTAIPKSFRTSLSLSLLTPIPNPTPGRTVLDPGTGGSPPLGSGPLSSNSRPFLLLLRPPNTFFRPALRVRSARRSIRLSFTVPIDGVDVGVVVDVLVEGDSGSDVVGVNAEADVCENVGVIFEVGLEAVSKVPVRMDENVVGLVSGLAYDPTPSLSLVIPPTEELAEICVIVDIDAETPSFPSPSRTVAIAG